MIDEMLSSVILEDLNQNSTVLGKFKTLLIIDLSHTG